MQNSVILVDEQDNQIGVAEKLKAHQQPLLHRSFSIFVFNAKSQILLQKRAKTKYHSGGLWSNTCCSHPMPGEDINDAVHRRLQEEMGFDCPLQPSFTFLYKAKLDNDLWEHELDHVFVGSFEGDPKPDPNEAEEWKWVSWHSVVEDVEKNPQNYTYWFREIIKKLKNDGKIDTFYLSKTMAVE